MTAAIKVDHQKEVLEAHLHRVALGSSAEMNLFAGADPYVGEIHHVEKFSDSPQKRDERKESLQRRYLRKHSIWIFWG